MADVLVFIEVRAGKINKASLEAASEAKRLADKLGGKACAVAIGPCATLAEIGAYGCVKVFHVADAPFANYSQDGYARVVAKAAKETNAAAVLFAATAQGKDLAPRVAARLETGYAADVVELGADGGKVTAKRPIYAGKGFVRVVMNGTFVASLRPNVFPASKGSGTAEIAAFAPGIGAGDMKAVVTAILAASGGKLDVAEADIIVTGGRGLKGPENWALVENLAAVLGAATGASRAVVDAGWRPHAEQVGQTGKTVSPKLYIALGVSGAIQHLAGMSSSKVIVAINKDPQAPIFKVADFGIVGDVFEVVPKLTEALKAALGK